MLVCFAGKCRNAPNKISFLTPQHNITKSTAYFAPSDWRNMIAYTCPWKLYFLISWTERDQWASSSHETVVNFCSWIQIHPTQTKSLQIQERFHSLGQIGYWSASKHVRNVWWILPNVLPPHHEFCFAICFMALSQGWTPVSGPGSPPALMQNSARIHSFSQGHFPPQGFKTDALAKPSFIWLGQEYEITCHTELHREWLFCWHERQENV